MSIQRKKKKKAPRIIDVWYIGKGLGRGHGHREAGISINNNSNYRKEKAQLEYKAKTIQDRGMINLKYNAIIVKYLGIMLQNVELQVPKLIRGWIMLKRRNCEDCTLLLARNDTSKGQENWN